MTIKRRSENASPTVPGAMLALIAMVCSAASSNGLADTSTYQPANFKPGKESLEARLKFPEDAPRERTTLLCHTTVGQLGRMGPVSCYSTKDNTGYRYSEEVMQANNFLSMSPATINGVPQQVEMQFRVEFFPENTERPVQVYPNSGFYDEKLGNGYFTSQRILQDNELNSFCDGTHDFITETDISTDGVASNRRVVSPNDNEKCSEYYIARASKENFIPAMADGKPFASVRVERWYSRDQVRR